MENWRWINQFDDRNGKIHGRPCQLVIAHGTPLHRRYVQNQGAVKRLLYVESTPMKMCCARMKPLAALAYEVGALRLMKRSRHKPRFSLAHSFISEAASFLHQPRQGGFIAKSTCFRKCFLPGRNPAVVTLRSGSEAARFAHREVLRLTPQSEVKRSAIVPQAHFTREARLHVRRTLHVPRRRNASLQKSTCFRKCFLPGGD